MLLFLIYYRCRINNEEVLNKQVNIDKGHKEKGLKRTELALLEELIDLLEPVYEVTCLLQYLALSNYN